jgi:hypothetical protein
MHRLKDREYKMRSTKEKIKKDYKTSVNFNKLDDRLSNLEESLRKHNRKQKGKDNKEKNKFWTSLNNKKRKYSSCEN